MVADTAATKLWPGLEQTTLVGGKSHPEDYAPNSSAEKIVPTASQFGTRSVHQSKVCWYGGHVRI